MPSIYTLPLGDYQTNTYIISGNGKNCAIIDPGFEPETILAQVRTLGLTVDAILLTHGHFDHVGAVEQIVAATGCELWMSKADWALPGTPMNRYLYPLASCDFTDVFFCNNDAQIPAGGLSFAVLSTPGHTPGSVCFLCEDMLFSGDTLFAGSCGRTDLPGGDRNAMAHSLSRLAKLDRPFVVYPGHGCATTLRQERLSNPYLR